MTWSQFILNRIHFQISYMFYFLIPRGMALAQCGKAGGKAAPGRAEGHCHSLLRGGHREMETGVQERNWRWNWRDLATSELGEENGVSRVSPRVLACAARWLDGRSIPWGGYLEGGLHHPSKALLLLELSVWDCSVCIFQYSGPYIRGDVAAYVHHFCTWTKFTVLGRPDRRYLQPDKLKHLALCLSLAWLTIYTACLLHFERFTRIWPVNFQPWCLGECTTLSCWLLRLT